MRSLLSALAIIISTTFFHYSLDYEITRTIKGIVTDSATNSPLIFANVVCTGTRIGTQTDLDGRFSMDIPDTCVFLDVSYTGYPSKRVDISGKDTVHIKLHAGQMLNAVEVVEYKVPLVEQDNTTQGGIITGGRRNINIQGSRKNATNYYMDGFRVSSNIQSSNIHNKIKTDVAFHTEDYSHIVENEFHSPKDAPLSTFSVDVDAASYSNMRRYLDYGQRPPKDAIRIEELINYFDYDYPQPLDAKPIAIYSEVGNCPWAPDHKLIHIGIQGKAIPVDNLPASNLVFLIDVSGSMGVENKLPLVISSFKLLVEQLRERDRVAIVVYAGSSGLVLPSTPGNRKDEIIASLDRLQAGGSTAGAEGIKLAYQVARENFITNGNNRVILATDGDFNVGVSSDGELVGLIEKERESGVFLTVLGFGMGNYKDNKMQELADHGNGNHGYVDNISEAKKVFVHEFGGTLFTIAKDVKIQVEFNPALVASYRLIGYENRMLEAEDFNDDKKDAGEIGSNHTVTALYEIIPVGTETASLRDVDDLKYQKSKKVVATTNTDELLTVKFRYKAPDGDVSKLIEGVIHDTDLDFNKTSSDFRFSAAVASFGMLLRDSDFAGNATFEDVLAWASHAKGDDALGYRKEFLDMVRMVPTIPDFTAEK